MVRVRAFSTTTTMRLIVGCDSGSSSMTVPSVPLTRLKSFQCAATRSGVQVSTYSVEQPAKYAEIWSGVQSSLWSFAYLMVSVSFAAWRGSRLSKGSGSPNTKVSRTRLPSKLEWIFAARSERSSGSCATSSARMPG